LESPGRLLEQTPPGAKGVQLPPFGLTIATILVPVALMLFASGAKLWLSPQHVAAPWFELLGHPLVALLVAVLVSFYTFGVGRGFTWEQILNFSNECLGPVASVLLVIGAGGGFNGVLIASGVGGAIAGLTASWALSPLILGWLIAALIRVATGSATVAITTAAGIMAPIVSRTPGVNVELLVISMGAGSLILSHVNDGGFWLVKEYLQLSVTETLRTWTVMETIISILALILTLLLNLLLGA
jgi:GntP family gluconate:H+ symporter